MNGLCIKNLKHPFLKLKTFVSILINFWPVPFLNLNDSSNPILVNEIRMLILTF